MGELTPGSNNSGLRTCGMVLPAALAGAVVSTERSVRGWGLFLPLLKLTVGVHDFEGLLTFNIIIVFIICHVNC